MDWVLGLGVGLRVGVRGVGANGLVVQLPAEMDPLLVPPGQGAEIMLRSRPGQHLTFGIMESAMQVCSPLLFIPGLLCCLVLVTLRGEALPGGSVE